MYPKGTKFNLWSICSENKRSIIRRWVVYPDGQKKLERYPIKAFKSIQNDPIELKNFVTRINQDIPKEQRTKQVIEIRHAFISPVLLSEYQEFLNIQIPNQSKARYEYSLLLRYCLQFFVNTLQLNSPVQWHEVHEIKWAKFLLDKGPKAKDTKQKIIIATNRFVGWLHRKRPQEIPPLVFQPLSKAKFKEIEAIREMKGEKRLRVYIPEADWNKIEKKLPSRIRGPALLSYYFGLRRSEALGLLLEDVKNGHLDVKRQLRNYTDKEPIHGPLKGRAQRKVPYWEGVSPNKAYEWIGEIQLMHPDTFTDEWNAFITTLDMDYDLHDLRHTWITRMMRRNNHRDVQLAAGHVNITTTMGYSHDDRELDNQIFIPIKKIS